MFIKLNDSGPARFMYSVIAICVITTIICFGLFYGGKTDSELVQWIGIVTFTIMYHFWVRIIMGNVSKLFKKHIRYEQWWFKEHKFEKGLYKLLKVKKWKDKAFTYNPGDFDVNNKPLEEIANIMAKSEVDHWINEAISVSTMFFGLIWGHPLVFIISALCGMVFDSQFIIIQRYNRPRIIKAMEHKKKSEAREEKKNENITKEDRKNIFITDIESISDSENTNIVLDENSNN